MSGAIDFYFEFSSPYGYIASELIDGLASKYNRTVNWKPFLLGAIFKLEGTQSLVDYPMKGQYSKHDIARSARYHGLEFRWPEAFPIFTVNAARAIYWGKDAAPDKDKDLSQAIYRKAFREGKDIANLQVLGEAAIEAGVDADAMLEGIKLAEVKQRLKDEMDLVVDRKIFGSPFFYIDNEPFWGVDRFPQMEKWLESGGW